MSKSIALICGILIWVGYANAQPYLSTNSRFQVDEIKGCAPFTLTLTNLLAGNCDAANPCSMDYEGNNQQTLNLFSYTYTNPGTYKLKVLYQGQGSDEITITVVENIEPEFEIYSCFNADVTIKVLEKSYQQLIIDFTNDGIPEITIPSGNNALASHDYATPGTKTIAVRGKNLNAADNCNAKVETFNALSSLPAPTISNLTILDPSTIKLDFITQPHIQYRLEIAVNNSSNFQVLNTLYEPGSITVPSLKPEENYYCFRLGAHDACNNTTGPYSNIICSSDVSLNFQNGVNNVLWSTSGAGVTNTIIERNGTVLTSIPGSPASFADNLNFECNKEYCYRIINQYGGGITSRSLEFCDKSFLIINPPAISNTTASVSTDGVRLEWIQDPISTTPSYQILRSSDGQNFSLINGSSATSFLDANYTTENNYSYRIDYRDECDNKSPEGLIIKPIKLTGSITNNIVTLEWTDYEGWINGVSNYEVDKYNQQGNVIQTIIVASTTSFIDDQPDPDNQLVRYRVRAIANQNNLKDATSNTLSFVKDSKLFSPTAFTPNGDKLNDTFTVSGQYIVKSELSIFNRWGELIFVTNKKGEPWDGTFQGKPAAEDAYIWSIEVTDLAGRTYKESGTVALLRRKK